MANRVFSTYESGLNPLFDFIGSSTLLVGLFHLQLPTLNTLIEAAPRQVNL